jgi:hypothetical protein
MGQVKIDPQSKCVCIPRWLIFSKKIPLNQIKQKAECIENVGGHKIFKLTLAGDFGKEEITFSNYDSYATFIYEYQKALLSA